MTGIKTMEAYRRNVAQREAAHPVYEPTLEQIAAACERMREGWRETDKRSAGPPPVETQVVAVPVGVM